jgi:hypothetical protein
MNLWGVTPDLFPELDAQFRAFLAELTPEKALKAEFYLPSAINSLVQRGVATVRVLPTEDKWFGVTYREDKDKVVGSLRALIESGFYPEKLFD